MKKEENTPDADSNRDSSSAQDSAWRLVDATLMHRSSRQTTRSNLRAQMCSNIKKEDISSGYPLIYKNIKERETGIECDLYARNRIERSFSAHPFADGLKQGLKYLKMCISFDCFTYGKKSTQCFQKQVSGVDLWMRTQLRTQNMDSRLKSEKSEMERVPSRTDLVRADRLSLSQ